eukprot:scaffold297092_cov17-Tisochrysis_lutea.AAC.1
MPAYSLIIKHDSSLQHTRDLSGRHYALKEALSPTGASRVPTSSHQNFNGPQPAHAFIIHHQHIPCTHQHPT